ncbi:MAG: hypothetical protein GX040_11550 [Alcaligenaceae bacterium]|nr:hypothetical protein [Alcaligenaceae bacterium]
MTMNRRAFLSFGKKAVSQSPWQNFCQRVARSVKGDIRDDGEIEGYGAASVSISRLADALHLQALCAEYDTAMVLDGIAVRENVIGRSCLSVRLDPSLSLVEPLGENACLAQPAATAGQLLALGYRQFERVPAEVTLAHWLASPEYHDIRPGYTHTSGLERIHVMFADGKTAVLGGFGVNDESVLSISSLQRIVPNLFELLREEDVEWSLGLACWPYSYRLDALKSLHADINLARVFLGHRATLVWAQEMVIRKMSEPPSVIPGKAVLSESEQERLVHSIIHVEGRVKGLFDPSGVFLYLDECL